MPELPLMTDCPEEDAMVHAIYKAYPRKVGRPNAEKKIRLAIKHYDPQMVLLRTIEYSNFIKGKIQKMDFIPHPATWFGQKRFLYEDLWDHIPQWSLQKLLVKMEDTYLRSGDCQSRRDSKLRDEIVSLKKYMEEHGVEE